MTKKHETLHYAEYFLLNITSWTCQKEIIKKHKIRAIMIQIQHFFVSL